MLVILSFYQIYNFFFKIVLEYHIILFQLSFFVLVIFFISMGNLKYSNISFIAMLNISFTLCYIIIFFFWCFSFSFNFLFFTQLKYFFFFNGRWF